MSTLLRLARLTPRSSATCLVLPMPVVLPSVPLIPQRLDERVPAAAACSTNRATPKPD